MTDDQDQNNDPVYQDPTGYSEALINKPEPSRWEYWEKIRVKDPARYWRHDIQKQIHREAHNLGQDFYKRGN
jgi:hypothetical protein